MAEDPPSKSNVIVFPNCNPSNARRVTVEEYSQLMIYDVLPVDGARGIFIDGFTSKAESDKFIHDLDDFFLGAEQPDTTPSGKK
jgi:hypothetical protein